LKNFAISIDIYLPFAEGDKGIFSVADYPAYPNVFVTVVLETAIA
jgi:hypothetical protein